MATTTTTTSTGASAAKDEQTRQFAIDCARHAANTRCHNVVCLDVRGISPVTDYMVLATGTSPRQMRTVCDELAELAEQRGEHAFGSEGFEASTRARGGGGAGNDDAGGGWMLIDFVTVVVHVFTQDARAFYDLDSLWGDAKKVDVPAAPPADKPNAS